MDPNQQAQQRAMQHARQEAQRAFQQAQQQAQHAHQQAQRAHHQAHQQAQQAVQQWQQRVVQGVYREDLPERRGGTGVGGRATFRVFMALMVLAFIGLLAFYFLFIVHPG